MSTAPYSVPQLASLMNAHVEQNAPREIRYLLTDSRRLIFPESTLFFALKTKSNNGHKFVADVYEKGGRAFVVHPDFDTANFSEATFFVVENSFVALQKLAENHRKNFQGTLVGIAGSNGKTVVKEWLFSLTRDDYKVVRSPRSYNSQIGVPLSLWNIREQHNLAIIEAGISQMGEMEKLEKMMKPTVGIFTHLGAAHAQGFTSLSEKAHEKAKLFAHCEKVIFCADNEAAKLALHAEIKNKNALLGWSFTAEDAALKVKEVGAEIKIECADFLFAIPAKFQDAASRENMINAAIAAKILGVENERIAKNVGKLSPIEMRLEERKAVNNNLLINDFYNADPDGVRIALNLLAQQPGSREKIVVLSALQQISASEKKEAYAQIVEMLNRMELAKVVGVGEELKAAFSELKHPTKFYKTTQALLADLPNLKWKDAAILLKAARKFHFEKIAQVLVEQPHQTWLEVDLDAMAHNLRFYRGKLAPSTKLMAMVKALSYGTGTTEIATWLQFNKVDYLAVAYANEGIRLRKAGIHLPIMVMNADEAAFESLVEYKLEPEVFSSAMLEKFVACVQKNHSENEPFPIHIKLETGMHRLGFSKEELPALTHILQKQNVVKVASAFSHLAAADVPKHDDFTRQQIARFEEMTAYLKQRLPYKFMRHLANTSGIARFAEAHFDMVRLGIGLYGAANSAAEREKTLVVGRWKTRISQVKKIAAGESVGYGRQFMAEKETTIATLPVGYADGYFRALGKGRGHVFVAGQKVPVVGNVCMDMIMVDVSGLAVSAGDEVELMGEHILPTKIAAAAGTIPYEILTHISTRVPRVYVSE